MGAVYMGALTYIGNAPNFMVYAIANERGVKMPSFFGYMLWSGAVLILTFRSCCHRSESSGRSGIDAHGSTNRHIVDVGAFAGSA